MVMDPQGKRPSPCWKFATTWKCQYDDQCRFTNHSDDVKAYNAAKMMGQSTFRRNGLRIYVVKVLRQEFVLGYLHLLRS